MRAWAYPAVLTAAEQYDRDDRGLIVTFPDVPEAVTQGDDEADALAEALDYLACALEGYIAAGRDISPPSPPAEGQRLVVLPSLMAAKLALYRAMRAEGVRTAALAQRLPPRQKVAKDTTKACAG